MSHSYAWPPEQNPAQAAQAEPDAARADLRAALALCALPQVFDFAITGIAAFTVFPHAFFGRLPAVPALGAGLAVWLLAYGVAAAVWRWRPAKAWRGKGAARLGLTVATVSVALMPEAAVAAWAPAGLVLARLIQGLAIGRLASGLPSPSDGSRRAVAAQGWAVAIAAALVMAALLVAGLGLTVSRQDLVAWGWRYPFFIALALNLAAFAADMALQRIAAGAPVVRAHQRPRLATLDGVRLD